jgi:phage terminase large subunit-like protein
LEKLDGFVCVKTRQGVMSLSAPSKSLETAILNRQLRHDGHPVLRWNISNASVKADDNDNIKPSKSFSTGRIDGVSALVMAVDLMDRNASTPIPSGPQAEWL